jgi:hypothetical protein
VSFKKIERNGRNKKASDPTPEVRGFACLKFIACLLLGHRLQAGIAF